MKKKIKKSQCIKAKIGSHPIILCFEGEEIALNKAGHRFLRRKK